jgi:osmotically-inducible protein OsmY
MARSTGKNPKSYDDIVRGTVLDPDSSVRPTREQEREAREGFRAQDAGEHALQARVTAALAASGVDTSKLTVEVTGELVRLGGEVADPAALRTLEDAVARVSGVETIHNQVVISSAR